MEELTCVVIGGGYAGIHALNAIRKSFKGEENKRTLRLILMDKNPYHTRKVLLFRPAVGEEEITIPLAGMIPEEAEFIQASVLNIDSHSKKLLYQDAAGEELWMHYDVLVVALGSVVRAPDPEQGGLALTGLDQAKKIRETWQSNMKLAVKEQDQNERRRLMSIAIAGAGISGIETSAELAHSVREGAAALGLDPNEVRITLFNANPRLFSEGPAKVGRRLEDSLQAKGVTVLHGRKVIQERDGIVTLSDGDKLSVGLCVWTLGLLPHPALHSMGLPVHSDGYVIVDECYRVQGAQGIYSIGDCARVVDPVSRHVDGKTCKEALGQASRIGKIIIADLSGDKAPSHRQYMDFFCFGLGPEHGMAWTHKWGVDLIFTGKLGSRLRKFTWDSASLIK